MLKFAVKVCTIFILLSSCKDVPKKVAVEEPEATSYYTEPYRPQYHFSPQEKWMNDPNGLVYHEGMYHLFYQYYPDDIVRGPMHWGHATSKDLIHWEHKPIALYPDEHGLIFSGSAVVDHQNTSGFGTEENPPLVAIFTYHNMDGEKAGEDNFQTQGIAYSLDNGDTWTKYEGNPVILNEGIRDFRDSKVFWNELKNNWTMLLVAGDHLQIWQSKNLREWEKVSEFGKDKGAHGGVRECPDMFKLKVEGTDTEKWVLLISINPGAPNGGSGTQYFVGDFDGTTFTTNQEDAKWVDWGRDNYAGVTYNNVPDNERIFIGWMSNWAYARDTPTEVWRSANTIPRNLSLHENNGEVELYSYPIANFDKIVEHSYEETPVALKPMQKTQVALKYGNQSEIRFKMNPTDSKWIFSNGEGDSLVITLNKQEKMLLLDRSKSERWILNPNLFLATNICPFPIYPKEKWKFRCCWIIRPWKSF
ncbi:glycoside hydrolase family 32 protein [Maribacter litopenaei]|uniref:Glycoside hydrolase family 32 protein n=1 Tax=Maribacter litopenaei TaxID=2976127 RepID=A0ABY5Y6D6_9FLAO|nr:glycoside hydrolase family 32 protein [Maribacter litopenaei]UWX54578.1 glycoside hydrolase family 32 protein [Maribacter litopenaei]